MIYLISNYKFNNPCIFNHLMMTAQLINGLQWLVYIDPLVIVIGHQSSMADTYVFTQL